MMIRIVATILIYIFLIKIFLKDNVKFGLLLTVNYDFGHRMN